MSKNPLIQQVGDTFTPQANLNKMSSLGAGVRNLKQGIALGCTKETILVNLEQLIVKDNMYLLVHRLLTVGP